jgi:hypothetical protein
LDRILLDIQDLKRRIFFIVSLLLFLAHQLAQKVWGVVIPWADAYLDPLLCMPLLLTGLAWQQRWLSGRPRLRLAEIVLATAMVAFFSEWLFPLWSASFTADPCDVAAYFAGAALFFLFSR